MNPLIVLGWLAAVLMAVLVIAVIAAVIFLTISISLFLRDKRREVKAKEEADKRMFDSAPVPYFKGMESGDVFKVDHQAWEIMTLETEKLPEYGQTRLRIMARSLSDDQLT